MSRIDELISELCPDGVEYRALTEVATYVRGVTYKKSDEQIGGPIRILRSNNITLSSNTLNFDDVKRVASTVRVRPDQRLRANDILISAASGSRSHVGKVAFISEDIDYSFGGFMGVLRTVPAMEPRFLFHLMTGKLFSTYLDVVLNTTTINNLNSSIISGFRVPVPPMEVQREIVRILDTFSALEAELEAELEARRTQYEHYRDHLLTFGDQVGWKPMGDVLKLQAGKFIRASDISQIQDEAHPFPCYGGNGIRGYVSQANHSGTHPLIGRQGALCGNVQRANGEFYATEHAVVVSPRKQVDIDWVFHLLDHMNLNQYATKSAQPGLAVGKIEQLPIPVPPLAEQKRIVGILDKFDALVNDLSVGLPAELAARRTQYEHYRDRLLTFEERV